VRNDLRRREGIKVACVGEPFNASVAGTDAGTDLAVLRVESNSLKPAETSGLESARVGELVLSVGRSVLGDISASSGIIARLGSPWRTWRGGQIDRLLRCGYESQHQRPRFEVSLRVNEGLEGPAS